MSLRLGLVTGEFPPQPGGVGDFTRELAGALAALGAEVHVLTRAHGRELAASGYAVHPVVRRWSFAALLRLRALARHLRLDMMNVQYQAAAYGLGLPIHFLPDLAGCRTAVTFHDLRIPYLFPKAGRLRPAAVSHLARAAAGVIATDPADERELRRRGVRRLANIPIGSNVAPAPPPGYERTAWRRQHGVTPADFLLGYFGFLNSSKGGDTLIRALAVLAERRAPVRLVLIGGPAGASDPGDQAFEAQVRRLIARHDLEDRVLTTGFVPAPEVSAWLLACEAVALPYRDGVSFRRGSLMAALAHGCPVISTRPAGPLPGLRDGENIRLVPPDDAPALVLAVTQLLDAPALRGRLGQGARALSAEFTWERIARRTLEFLEGL